MNLSNMAIFKKIIKNSNVHSPLHPSKIKSFFLHKPGKTKIDKFQKQKQLKLNEENQV